MFIFDIIEPFYFLMALFFGLFMVYLTTPTPDIIIKYPTPQNAKETVFKDDASNCYKFNATEIKCPLNKLEIHKIPIERKIETFTSKKINKIK